MVVATPLPTTVVAVPPAALPLAMVPEGVNLILFGVFIYSTERGIHYIFANRQYLNKTLTFD